jgi:hypothetical protein
VLNATLDASGRIVASGTSGSAIAVARFNVNGTPDTTFGNGGLVTTAVGNQSTGPGLAIYPNAGQATDGDIVIAGLSSNGTKQNLLVASYLGQPTGPYFQITGPSSVTAGTANTYTIAVFNPDGSADTGYSGTVQITSSDAQAVLPANFTISGNSATFSATLKKAGIQSLTATDTVTAAITGSDASIQVNPTAASSLVVSGFPTSITQANSGTFTVTAYDPYGNVATGYTGTVHFTSSDPRAVLPADYTFTAADLGVHTFTATFNTVGTEWLAATDTLNSSVTGIETGIVVKKKK